MQIFDSDEVEWTTIGVKRDTVLDIWLKTSIPGSWYARSIHELHDVDVFETTVAKRRVMLNSWVLEMKEELGERLRHALSSYNVCKTKLDIIRTEVNLRVLCKRASSASQLVDMTLSTV